MTVAEFFAPPNRVHPDDRSANGSLAEAAMHVSGGPLILPWDDGRGRPRWYVIGDPGRLEQIREEIVAHAGITYTDFRGQLTQLESRDPADEAANRIAANGEVIRLELLDERALERVARSLARFLNLWGARPPPPPPRPRAAAEILRDYRLALNAGRRPDAESAIVELRTTGALDSSNLYFLEFETLTRFEPPTAALGYPMLPALLKLRRPARLTDLIAQAIDRGRIRMASPRSIEEIRARFASLGPMMRDLLTSAGECRSTSGALLLALRIDQLGEDVSSALRQLPPSVELDDETRSLIEDLVATTETTRSVVVEPAPSLSDLLDTGRYDAALELAAELSPTVATVEAALRCAQWLDSIDAAEVALGVFESAPEDVRERFTESRLVAPMVETLRSFLEEGTAPKLRSWNEFFERLWKNPEWREAVEIASHGAIEWPVAPFVIDPAATQQLAGHISHGADSGIGAFGLVIPYVVEWLDRFEGGQRDAVREVEEALLLHFALNDLSRSGLDLLGALATDVIASGLHPDRYGLVLESLVERWEKSHAPATVEWAADVIEAVIDNPCPNPEKRGAFVGQILQILAQDAPRVTNERLRLLRDLAGELGVEELVPLPEEAPAQEAELARDLRGLFVVLYSLTESALNRARAYLEQRWPDLRVEARSDHVGSNELEALAMNADLVVIATRSAKHAATDFIRDNRVSRLATRIAGGKGSASLIREVEEWVAGLP